MNQNLTYHQATADLLGRPLVVSPGAVALLDETERLLGVSLPASVREWYSLEGAVDILGEHSNMDHPIPLSALGGEDLGFGGEPDDALAAGLLVVMVENQSVSFWAVSLDGSDDPPVLVDLGLVGKEGWHLCAERFSIFVYTQVWDWGKVFGSGETDVEGCRVMALDRPLTGDDLDWLRRHFDEGPRTYGWPRATNYRFADANDTMRMLIQNDEGEQGDWYLWADGADTLKRLVTLLWDRGTLAHTLEALGDDECGEVVLDDMRR